MMLFGADISFFSRTQLQSVLEYTRGPNSHLYLACKRHWLQTFSVVNYIEKYNLAHKVSFFPYYDVCKDFPVLKKDCHIWFDEQNPVPEYTVSKLLPNNKKRVLFATMFNPLKYEGNSVVIRYWLDIFKQRGYEVHLLYYPVDQLGIGNNPTASLHDLCHKLIIVPVANCLSGCNRSGLNVHVDDWCGPEVIKAVKKLVLQYSYDICFTNYVFFTAIFEECPAYTEKILLTHDSFANRNRKFLAQGFPESGWMSVDEAGEKQACNRSNKIIALQAEEAEYFKSLVPPDIKVVSIPPLGPAVSTTLGLASGAKLRVGYLGSRNYINEHNLTEFIYAVVANNDLCRSVHLLIAGGVSEDIYEYCPEESFEQLEHSLLGRVDSLQNFYEQCDVVINPERGGTGIKIKTLDALAHGAALVCTKGASLGTCADSPYHIKENIADITFALADIVKDRSLVQSLCQESQRVYNNLLIQCSTGIYMTLGMQTNIQTENVPLIKEGKDIYFLDMFKDILQYTSVQDKTILEIGSDRNLVMAHLCVANGAKEIYACNIGFPQDVKGRARPANLHLIAQDFAMVNLPAQKFDFIFCIATLEHFMDFESILQKILSLLKPGGKVYLQGEPFWTCGNGHHLWVSGSESGTSSYTFAQNNPVEDWSHLVLSAEEMQTHLQKKVGSAIYSARDVDLIVDNIYVSSTSNKQLPSHLCAQMDQYFYYTKKYSKDGQTTNAFYEAAKKHISEADLRCSGLTLFGRPKQQEYASGSTPLISIIVPCYNVQTYVAQCLDSIIAQRDVTFEVILVDDKSTDGTLDVLRKYAVYNKNFALCQHEYNQGLGPARNTGVLAAQGKYLFFLDSDDYFATDLAISQLLHIAEKEQCPIVIGSCQKRLPDGSIEEFDTKQREQWGGEIDVAVSGEVAFKGSYLLEKNHFIPLRAWGVLLDAGFYAEYGFTFPLGAHEDLAVMPFVYAKADKVFYSSNIVVMYRERAGSLSNTGWTKAKCSNALLHWSVILRNIKTFSLEQYTSAIAISVLGHNIYKVLVNGLNDNAIQEFFDSVHMITRSVTSKVNQQNFDAMFCMFRGLKEVALSQESYAKALSCFHHENISEFYTPEGALQPRRLYQVSIATAGKLPNDKVLNAILHKYYSLCPQSVKDYPAMLTHGDRASYFYYATQVQGTGLVIDTGCLVGGTTKALVEGLQHNSMFKGKKPQVYVYDLFRVDEGYIRQWLKDIFGKAVTDEITNFRLFFDQLTQPFADTLHVHEGDIIKVGYTYKQPIELLGLDCCKTLGVTDSVVRNFFPYLIPSKSIVIHQDYIHEWHPYIHISMELLADYFEPVLEIEGGGSYIWRCIKQITPTCIEHIFGSADQAAKNNFAWYADHYTRNDILLQKKQMQMLYPQNQVCFNLTRGIYAKQLGYIDQSRQLGKETMTQYANYCSLQSISTDVRAALFLQQDQAIASIDFTLLIQNTPHLSTDLQGQIADYITAINKAHVQGQDQAVQEKTVELALFMDMVERKQFPQKPVSLAMRSGRNSIFSGMKRQLASLKQVQKATVLLKVFIKKHRSLYIFAKKMQHFIKK